MNYLFGITIGPVQTYIEESRKLLDLQNSSKIISDIMAEILEDFKKECQKNGGFELIYPCFKIADDKGEHSIDCSNYAIAELKNDSNENINKLGEKIKNIVTKVLIEVTKDPEVPLDEIIYPFWAIEEITDTYEQSYKKLSLTLRALKNTYDFEQNTQMSGKKCVLCGKYTVINNSDGQKEELCKYCNFKRIYPSKQVSKNNRIGSVYDIAISNWKYLNNEKKDFKTLKNLLEKIFKENHTTKYYSQYELGKVLKYLDNKNIEDPKNIANSKYEKELKEDLKGLQILKNQIVIVKKALEFQKRIYQIQEFDNKPSLKEPNYEYCFIQMDVDNLGKWMSGSYIPSYISAQIELKDFQKKLSSLFYQFGIQMKRLFSEQNNGLEDMCKIIYSGGDDLLMVLPVEKIFTVLDIIEKNFEEKVRQKFKEFYPSIYEQITYSISVTIAQCKNPMSYALQKTREELEYVKSRYQDNGKDGIAINYLINNGKEISCYLKRKNSNSFYGLIQQYLKYKDTIFFSYLNKFEQEFADFKLNDITFEEYLSSKRILLIEFERFLEKSIKKIKANQIETKEETASQNANDQDNDKEMMAYKKGLVNFVGDLLSENVSEEKTNYESLDFSNVINILKMYQRLATRCEWEVQS